MIMIKMDKSWMAKSDADTLRRALEIMNDKARFKAATKAAERDADEAQKQVATLKALGGSLTKTKNSSRTRKK